MTRSVAVLGLAVWLASACDPNDVPAQSVQQAAGVLQAVQDAKAERAANASDDFDACMGNCGAGAGATADDRATCRLTCQDAGGVAPPDASVAKAVLLRFDTCANGCIANASASDIATCRLQCTQSASRGPEAEAMGAEQRKCSTACLDALVTCDGGCGAPGADASTCRVHCEVDVTRCLARCG